MKGEDRGGEEIVVRSMTLEEARLALYKKIHGCSPNSELPLAPGVKTLTGTNGVTHTAKTEQEERLRPGRVAVRGEQLIRLQAPPASCSRSDCSHEIEIAGSKAAHAAGAGYRDTPRSLASLRRPSPQGAWGIRNHTRRLI
jgi:hypothetical protein